MAHTAEAEFRRLRALGVTLPQARGRAVVEANRMVESASDPDKLNRALFKSQNYERLNRLGSAFERENVGISSRMLRARTGSSISGSDTRIAWPKHRNPAQWWEDRNEFFKSTDEDPSGMKTIRDFSRLLYATHHLIPSLIDIYARFPLLDISFKHKDPKLVEFYEQVFFDQLDYEEFLFDASREHWIVGEAFPLANWNDTLGIWDREELIHPDDVDVASARGLSESTYSISVPNDLRQIVKTKNPREEYEVLVRDFPAIIEAVERDVKINIEEGLMSQFKFKVDPWNRRGTPILLRAFRTLMAEESLNATQEAVADRLYSPFILAKLGLESVDDSNTPWIPDAGELDGLNSDLQVALASDFRLMCYHHGLDIQNVFGREQMPRLDQDFDRIDRKLMQIFGIGPELLQGGKSNVPYASGALNRELITQMLTTYQGKVKRHIQDRMMAMAERQGHFEYEKRGDRRIPVMERALVEDPITGEQKVIEVPKLTVPEVQFKTMNLRDEAQEREFLVALKEVGFPISDTTLAVNLPIDFEEELERAREEKIEKVISEQTFKNDLFTRILEQDLTPPPEFMAEFQMWLSIKNSPAGVEQIMTEMMMAPPPPVEGELPPGEEGGPPAEGGPPPGMPMMGPPEMSGPQGPPPPGPPASPSISHEMMGGPNMPRRVGSIKRSSSSIRRRTRLSRPPMTGRTASEGNKSYIVRAVIPDSYNDEAFLRHGSNPGSSLSSHLITSSEELEEINRSIIEAYSTEDVQD